MTPATQALVNPGSSCATPRPASNAIPSQLKSRLTSGKYHQAVVGACPATRKGSFTAYNIAVLLYP